MQIVKVQYLNPVTNQFFSREYSYFSVDELKIGDIVNVPVKDSTGKAKVTSINVPESEIEAFKDKVKTIPAGSIIQESLDFRHYKVSPEPISDEARKIITGGRDEMISAVCGTDKDYTVTDKIGSQLMQTATVNIKPELNDSFVSLRSEVEKLAKYAESRVIKSLEDIKAATDDKVLIKKVSDAIEELRKTYTQPLNDHVKTINLTFKQLSEPLDLANKITDEKILTFRKEVEKKRQEAEAINQQKIELARKEASFNGTGEVTINTTPVEVPEVSKTVKTETGTLGVRRTRKARVIDFAKLPDTYKLENTRLLNAAASSGVKEIPGVEFYFEESITTRSR